MTIIPLLLTYYQGRPNVFQHGQDYPKKHPVLIPATKIGQDKCSCPYVCLKTWSGPVLVSSYVRAPLLPCGYATIVATVFVLQQPMQRLLNSYLDGAAIQKI